MPQIGQLVRDVFEAQAYDERGDLVMESLGHRPVSILLKSRGRDNRFIFTENITTFNDPHASRKAQSKSATTKVISACSDFCSLVRIPKTSSFSHPFPFMESMESVPVPLEGIIACVESDFDYPVFVKPDDGSVGRDACSVYNREALASALSAVFHGSKTVVVQEKVEIDREYRCVYFNKRAYLLFDRMFADRGVVNGRVTEASAAAHSNIQVQHVEDDELWGVAAQASQIVSDAIGLKYFAADFVTDNKGGLWFIEANTAPLISNAYTGQGVEQMHQMASSMIEYVRNYE